MADYIDRQTTIGAVHSAIYPYFCGAEDGDRLSDDEKLILSVNKTICKAIKALPPVDAVKVVRCKDCKHLFEDNKCPLRTWWTHTEDDFCSYGERKDGDHEQTD